MAITEKSKVVILPEDFQEKRSLAPGAQVMTIGELRNMFFKPFNWNGAYADTLLTDLSPLIDYFNLTGNFINANFLDVNGTILDDPFLDSVNVYNNWSGATFSGTLPSRLCSYFNCLLDNTSFDSCTLSGNASFDSCSMTGSSFITANLGDTVNPVIFTNSDLTNSNFAGVVFDPYVKFTNCKMDGVNLDNAIIDSVGGFGQLYFENCTGLPSDPRQMGSFSFGTGLLYWPPTGTYFNEVFEELFCKTIIVDGVKFAGQNLTNKVFGFYDAGSIVQTVLRNCDFKDTFIPMALNGDVVLFNNCNFYGAINLTDDPNNNAMIGEVDGAVIRWIDGAYWTYIAEQGTWVKQ